MTDIHFAPVLAIPTGVKDIDFYKGAFGAVEHMRLNNDDGSVHVAEFSIGEALFHLHEAWHGTEVVEPARHNCTTVTIGLFCPDPHALAERALAAGAVLIDPVTDFEYGYRQGTVQDPFGHRWTLQRRIPASPDWKG